MNGPFDNYADRVRQAALAVLVVASLATLGLVVMTLVWPDQVTRALRWWLLLVGLTALGTTARVAAKTHPIHRRTAFDLAQERWTVPPEPPERLRQIERLVASAGWDRREFQARLRPVLRQIAAQRLTSYLSINIDAEPEAARAALGEPVWVLLAPAIDVQDRAGPGISVDTLWTVVEALERLDGSHNART